MYSGNKRENPSQDRPCYSACSSCLRCEDKGKYAACNRCSGRHDPNLIRDPHDIDDRCRCSEGILQYRLQNGRLIKKRFHSNPFVGQVVTDAETKDEQDWRQYVTEQREKFDDPTFDPVTLEDGSSTLDWTDRNRGS